MRTSEEFWQSIEDRANEPRRWKRWQIEGSTFLSKQAIERYNKGLIAYGLGQFVFDYWQEKMRESIILRIDVSKGVIDYGITPVYINDWLQPAIAHGQEKEKLLSKIIRLSDEDKFSTLPNESVKYKAELLRSECERHDYARKYLIRNFYRYPISLLCFQILTARIKQVLWSLIERVATISKLWHR